jgi:soluble lytic murein transglycosylase-like protein
LSAAACLFAAFGISQIVTGANPPGERASSSTCPQSESCELKGSLAPDAQVSVAEPPVSPAGPSVSEAQVSLLVPQAVVELPTPLPEPKIISAALAAAEAEPLIEPEAPPTVAAEPQRWVGRWRPTTITFAYSNNHPVAPLAASAIEPTAPAEPWTDVGDSAAMPLDAQAGSRTISRLGICSAIVSAARGNDLPIPFFANLIWQESSFHLGEISHAGALGVAQFIPETANEHGLINPFEPIHAIHTSAKFLRRLQDQYRNLGFAAAAYNAGPGRVNEWLSKRRPLPGETRAYVMSITGHRADQWASAEFNRGPERVLMPAKAPCAEVAEEVAAEVRFVRTGRLIAELAAATRPPPKPPAVVAEAATAKAGDKTKAHDKPAKPRRAKDQSRPVPAPSVLELALQRAAAAAAVEPTRTATPRPRTAQAKEQAQAKVQSQIKVQTQAKSQTLAKAPATAHSNKSHAAAAPRAVALR